MQKSKKIMVRLYLQETKDSDLINRLDSLPTYMRNDLIKDSLRYYIENIVAKDKEEKGGQKTKTTGAKTTSDKFIDPMDKSNISFSL